MANNLDGKSNNLLLGVLLGAAVVALGVLAYFYYERRHEPVVKIDVPGFSGEIRKDNGGVDIEVGKDKPELGDQYRRTGQLALAQAINRLIGGSKGHRHHRSLLAGLWRKRQKLARILACQIGDGTHHSLLPQNLIREGRDVAHMDTATHHDAAFA